jgi:hypothetical protein
VHNEYMEKLLIHYAKKRGEYLVSFDT